jgi:hypothetical protein
MNDYTIIITASFIPSHPAITIIENTIKSLDLININNKTKIILAHDFDSHPNFKKYLDNLQLYIQDKPNFKIVTRSTRGYLTGNISNAIDFVDTKYILILQQDLPFINSFDIEMAIQDLEKYPQLKHIRFNKRHNIKAGFDSINNLFGLQLKATNYTYTRTPGWSDNNHLCLTSYYKDLILKECSDKQFMENALQGRIVNYSVHSIYGTWLFGPLNHNPMIKHTDGRHYQ